MTGYVEGWSAASLLFFLYIALAAAITPRLPTRKRAQAVAGALAGFLIALVSIPGDGSALHVWLLPPALLLLGYWSSGPLFAAPMPRVERVFLRLDERLQVRRAARRTPRALAELLELAYLTVYPLIPIALAVHLATAARPDPGRFWSVVLVTDFICFGFLPLVQTRPPRALEGAEPWASAIRPLNLRLLGKTSIGVNTFPSGHAGEALAVALLVSNAPWPLSAGIGVTALLISAGAVLGRYHYAADAAAGWIVAAGAWWLL